MSETKVGEPGLTISFEPPKYKCGTHGEHSFWVSFYASGEPTVLYCTRCILDFLDRQSIGKVTLP